MMVSLRNVRIGTSYLQGLVLDAALPYRTSDWAGRLLGNCANTLRAQYSAAMLPPAFSYLRTSAYDYSAPIMGEPADNRAQSSSASQRVYAASKMEQHHSSAETTGVNCNSSLRNSGIGSQQSPTKAIHVPNENTQLQSPGSPKHIPPETPTKTQAVNQTGASSGFSLADIGRALEAHNYPTLSEPRSMATEAVAKSSVNKATNCAIPASEAAVKVATNTSEVSCATPIQPMPMADVLIPSLPTAQTKDTSKPHAVTKEAAATTNVSTALTTKHAASKLPSPQRESLPASAVKTRAALESPRTSLIPQRIVPTADKSAAALPLSPTAKNVPLHTTSLKRAAAPSASGATSVQKSSHSSAPRKAERAVARVATRPRTVQRSPLAFLERSQLAHMRLRLFR